MFRSSSGEATRSSARVYLGLGASLGDRAENLRAALDRLNQYGVRVITVSPLYESPHFGLDPADSDRYPPHLNAVAVVETGLTPEELLDIVQAVEMAGGRERLVRWGPRSIDIDILAYDSLQAAGERLVLPHPGIAERAFVSRPLLDVAPGFELPNGTQLRSRLHDEPLRSQQIVKLDHNDWHRCRAGDWPEAWRQYPPGEGELGMIISGRPVTVKPENPDL